MNSLQLTAKASFSFLNFNPRLKPGAINSHYTRASAINLLLYRTLMICNIEVHSLISMTMFKEMTKREQILTKIKETISSREPKADIILFGSRARNDYKPDSDWDILVLMDKDKINLSDEQALRHPLYDIELDAGEIISLLIYSKKDWNGRLRVTPLYKNIKKEGIKL